MNGCSAFAPWSFCSLPKHVFSPSYSLLLRYPAFQVRHIPQIPKCMKVKIIPKNGAFPWTCHLCLFRATLVIAGQLVKINLDPHITLAAQLHIPAWARRCKWQDPAQTASQQRRWGGGSHTIRVPLFFPSKEQIELRQKLASFRLHLHILQ